MPPDLQKLVEEFGGHNKITPEAWAEFDLAKARWETDRRRFSSGTYYEGRKPGYKPPKPTRRPMY